MAHSSNIQHDTLEDISTKSRSKNLDKDGFVMLLKNVFGKNFRNKVPNDFDAWAVEKQFDWINRNIAKLFPNVPQSLLSFIPATFCQLDYYDRSPEELPEWMNIDKYRKGQKFVQKHYTALIVSKIMGLMYVYSFNEQLRPIILGEHSHTPYLGLQRYNFCRGSLEEIKQRMRDIYQYWIIQNLKELTPEWEHMTRCLVVPMNYYPLIYMPYKVMILITTDALNLNMPHLYASLNYTEWIAYKIYKFIFYSLKFSSVRAIANTVVRNIMNKAANFNAEKLAEIHEKSKEVLPDFSLTY